MSVVTIYYKIYATGITANEFLVNRSAAFQNAVLGYFGLDYEGNFLGAHLYYKSITITSPTSRRVLLAIPLNSGHHPLAHVMRRAVPGGEKTEDQIQTLRSLSTTVLEIEFFVQFYSSLFELPSLDVINANVTSLLENAISNGNLTEVLGAFYYNASVCTPTNTTCGLFQRVSFSYSKVPHPTSQPSSQPSSLPTSMPTAPAPSVSLSPSVGHAAAFVLIFVLLFTSGHFSQLKTQFFDVKKNKITDIIAANKKSSKKWGSNAIMCVEDATIENVLEILETNAAVIQQYVCSVFAPSSAHGVFSTKGVWVIAWGELLKGHSYLRVLHRPETQSLLPLAALARPPRERAAPAAPVAAGAAARVWRGLVSAAATAARRLEGLLDDVDTTEANASWSRFVASLQLFTSVSVGFAIITMMFSAQFPVDYEHCHDFLSESECLSLTQTVIASVPYCQWESSTNSCARNSIRVSCANNHKFIILFALLALFINAFIKSLLAPMFNALIAPDNVKGFYDPYHLTGAMEHLTKISAFLKTKSSGAGSVPPVAINQPSFAKRSGSFRHRGTFVDLKSSSRSLVADDMEAGKDAGSSRNSIIEQLGFDRRRSDFGSDTQWGVRKTIQSSTPHFLARSNSSSAHLCHPFVLDNYNYRSDDLSVKYDILMKQLKDHRGRLYDVGERKAFDKHYHICNDHLLFSADSYQIDILRLLESNVLFISPHNSSIIPRLDCLKHRIANDDDDEYLHETTELRYMLSATSDDARRVYDSYYKRSHIHHIGFDIGRRFVGELFDCHGYRLEKNVYLTKHCSDVCDYRLPVAKSTKARLIAVVILVIGISIVITAAVSMGRSIAWTLSVLLSYLSYIITDVVAIETVSSVLVDVLAPSLAYTAVDATRQLLLRLAMEYFAKLVRAYRNAEEDIEQEKLPSGAQPSKATPDVASANPPLRKMARAENVKKRATSSMRFRHLEEGEVDETSPQSLNAMEYFSTSRALARRFPMLFESKLALQFSAPFPPSSVATVPSGPLLLVPLRLVRLALLLFAGSTPLAVQRSLVQALIIAASIAIAYFSYSMQPAQEAATAIVAIFALFLPVLGAVVAVSILARYRDNAGHVCPDYFTSLIKGEYYKLLEIETAEAANTAKISSGADAYINFIVAEATKSACALLASERQAEEDALLAQLLLEAESASRERELEVERQRIHAVAGAALHMRKASLVSREETAKEALKERLMQRRVMRDKVASSRKASMNLRSSNDERAKSSKALLSDALTKKRKSRLRGTLRSAIGSIMQEERVLKALSTTADQKSEKGPSKEGLLKRLSMLVAKPAFAGKGLGSVTPDTQSTVAGRRSTVAGRRASRRSSTMGGSNGEDDDDILYNSDDEDDRLPSVSIEDFKSGKDHGRKVAINSSSSKARMSALKMSALFIGSAIRASKIGVVTSSGSAKVSAASRNGGNETRQAADSNLDDDGSSDDGDVDGGSRREARARRASNTPSSILRRGSSRRAETSSIIATPVEPPQPLLRRVSSRRLTAEQPFSPPGLVARATPSTKQPFSPPGLVARATPSTEQPFSPPGLVADWGSLSSPDANPDPSPNPNPKPFEQRPSLRRQVSVRIPGDLPQQQQQQQQQPSEETRSPEAPPMLSRASTRKSFKRPTINSTNEPAIFSKPSSIPMSKTSKDIINAKYNSQKKRSVDSDSDEDFDNNDDGDDDDNDKILTQEMAASRAARFAVIASGKPEPNPSLALGISRSSMRNLADSVAGSMRSRALSFKKILNASNKTDGGGNDTDKYQRRGMKLSILWR